jgi:hypothetical protein
MRYGEPAAANNTAWLVIGRHCHASAQPATASTTTPIAVSNGLGILKVCFSISDLTAKSLTAGGGHPV